MIKNYKPQANDNLNLLQDEGLAEQCRRANGLAAAVKIFLNEFVDKTGEANDLTEALYFYLGLDYD